MIPRHLRAATSPVGVLFSALFVLCAGGVVRGEDTGEEAGVARWRDAAELARHLDEACTAVEEACGTRFRFRPTVRVSSQATIESVLRGQRSGERGMLETAPVETRPFIAYYDPIERVVHVDPEAVAAVARSREDPHLLDEDVLRVILVHEATHALDFQRFPVRWVLACCSASDERLAIQAVLEGHAQMVAGDVASTWGIQDAFAHVTRLYTGTNATGDAGEEVFDQDAAFSYLQGESFLRIVRKAAGREGVEALLRDPPCQTCIVDRPALWLYPERRALEPDLPAILEVFLPLARRPGWEVPKWRLLGRANPVHPGDEEGAAPPATSAPGAGDPATAYIDNHGLYGGSPDGNRYVNVFLALCASDADAARYV
ncbi:MAG: hypothetical protein ACC662_11850, partial [Planctomycetota bacterium]